MPLPPTICTAARMRQPARSGIDAVAAWRDLRSDDDAAFDRDLSMDLSGLQPQVTWGTSVDQVQPIDGRVPDPRYRLRRHRLALP